MIPAEISENLKKRFGDALVEIKTEGVIDPFIKVTSHGILEISRALRDTEETRFDLLMCLSGLDYGNGIFGVVYHLNSTKWKHKFTVKVEVPATNPHVPSVESVWKTANWHEREAFDLIGIVFDGHPDLRRILLPDDWEGHPLQKSYQLPEFYNGMKVPY